MSSIDMFPPEELDPSYLIDCDEVFRYLRINNYFLELRAKIRIDDLQTAAGQNLVDIGVDACNPVFSFIGDDLRDFLEIFLINHGALHNPRSAEFRMLEYTVGDIAWRMIAMSDLELNTETARLFPADTHSAPPGALYTEIPPGQPAQAESQPRQHSKVRELAHRALGLFGLRQAPGRHRAGRKAPTTSALYDSGLLVDPYPQQG